ncbi:MAG: ring hydroxylating beta subunit [Phenylobacterium sp.]|jgi:hypothetical protein|nr:ring hydroxylating beta subunit [Phenylobacterium sp.]
MPPDPKAAGVGPLAAGDVAGLDLEGVARLLIRFSDAVDGRRPADIAAQFTPDGVFKPGDKAMAGPAAIEAFYRERLADPSRTTRHLWSNLALTADGEHAVRLRVVLTNYAFEPAVSDSEVQMRLGEVAGRCVRDAQGTWRFAEHLYQRQYALRLPRSDAPAPSPEPRP